MCTFKKLLNMLAIQERKRAFLILIMILVMALLDMVGVASIMPFMAILSNPELVETNTYLNFTYTKLGFTDPHQFLFALGILVFIILVVSLAFKALTTYAQLRFNLMSEYTISKRLMEGYLHQPYSWFLSRHSADLGKTVLSEVHAVISYGISPMMMLISQGAVAIVLLMLLILTDPKLACIVGLTLISSYAIIFKSTQGILSRIGMERVKANQERFTIISEAFGGSKEVKVGGLEHAYIRRFSEPAKTYARHEATAQVISQMPRFALEAIAFGGMLLVVLYLMNKSGSFANSLPIIALYAFAGYRLMPALQQVYVAITQLRFAGPAIDTLYKDIRTLRSVSSEKVKSSISFNQAITLNHIQYNYPNAPRPALKNLSLTIPVKSTVGLVGVTGSGKTTMVDLIMGLLEAQEGTLKVDDYVIDKTNCRAWQSAIGYVPQQIFLADDTVAANIAFGLDVKEIEYASVERAAKIANLHDFVVNELPQKYETVVGERGVRLSGGQRQRIGIARALYHSPKVLILDEATSGLDNLTEKAVMDAVYNLGHEITIILIAHRLSTVKDCDIIFLLDKGELKAQGTFPELTKSNERFRDIAVGY
jgi:ABC-type multidrug transport system fused ATPase/permease subunit